MTPMSSRIVTRHRVRSAADTTPAADSDCHFVAPRARCRRQHSAPRLGAASPASGVAAGRLSRSRPVRIVVPFAPGGGADMIARLHLTAPAAVLGQSFFVENRAGAAGRIGAGVVAKAEPDGQTLLMTTESSLVIAPHIGVPMSYDPLKDFAPISLLTRNTVILVVHPSRAGQHARRSTSRSRAPSPGRCSMPRPGVGGPNHLAGEIFKRMTGARHRARAVSGHRGGHPGGDLQPGRRHVGLPRRTDPAHPQRHAEGARGRRQGALAGAARCADGGGGGRAGLRGGLLDRAARARRHAAADRSTGSGARSSAAMQEPPSGTCCCATAPTS